MLVMKRTLCALLAILLTACSGATEPPAGFGSLTGEWSASKYAPDFGAEWNLSLRELSTGYVAGTVTRTSYGSLLPPDRRRVLVDTGRVAGEHRGIDIVLTLLYQDGYHVSFTGQQVEADIFRGTHGTHEDGGWGPLDFVRVDPA